MKRKLGAIVLVVALALSLGLVPAASVGASPGPGIVGLWHLDGNANDSSVNANHGTVTGATFVSGKFDEALSFDGNDYVEVLGSSSMNVSSSYTFEAWVYLPDYDTYRGFFRRGDLALTASEIEIYTQDAAHNGWLTVVHNRGGAFCYKYFTAFPLDQWVHLAVTWDGTSLKAYYNNSEQSVTGGSSGSMVSPAISVTPEPNYIGIGYQTVYMNGLIDEVRIWDEALDSTEIGESASLGDLVFTKELTGYEPWEGDYDLENPVVPINTPVTFTMEVEVDNSLTGLTLNEVMVKDRLGAELELSDGLTATAGTPSSTTTNNRSKKVFITWDIGSLSAATATLTIDAKTDINPGKGKGKVHQEYTEAGEYELNSGATLTFYVTIADEDISLVLTTDGLWVEAVGEDED